MGKYDSKRVLQVGSGYLTTQNIEYLKGNGAYVIAADKCKPQKNRYRNSVDEVIELDTDDYHKIIEFCKTNKIDAAVTNGSEISYEQCRIINEGIGNTFCHTEQQWQTFVNKGNFRKLCINSGLDVPETYFTGVYNAIPYEIKSNICFPVIVKPVDRAGGIGISVVYNSSQLDAAIRYAGTSSDSSSIIIEEYIEGKEVVFTYVVQGGLCKLTASADKYVYKDERNLTVIPDLYIYPCADHQLYVDEINKKVLTMMKNQGMNNCTIFFQTIERNGSFYFFESGLRFEGTKTYLITSYLTGQNAYHFYYDFLLKTKTDYDINLDDPELNGHTLAMFAVHLRKGRIRKITGAEAIRNNKKITQRYYLMGKGSIAGKLPMSKIFSAYCMDGSDRKELAEQIRFIKQNLKVKGFFNRNMIVDSFDENILLSDNRM